MTALLALVIVAAIIVVPAGVVRHSSAGRRRLRDHNRALNTLGHITSMHAEPGTPDGSHSGFSTLQGQPEEPPGVDLRSSAEVMSSQAHVRVVSATAPAPLPAPKPLTGGWRPTRATGAAPFRRPGHPHEDLTAGGQVPGEEPADAVVGGPNWERVRAIPADRHASEPPADAPPPAGDPGPTSTAVTSEPPLTSESPVAEAEGTEEPGAEPEAVEPIAAHEVQPTGPDATEASTPGTPIDDDHLDGDEEAVSGTFPGADPTVAGFVVSAPPPAEPTEVLAAEARPWRNWAAAISSLPAAEDPPTEDADGRDAHIETAGASPETAGGRQVDADGADSDGTPGSTIPAESVTAPVPAVPAEVAPAEDATSEPADQEAANPVSAGADALADRPMWRPTVARFDDVGLAPLPGAGSMPSPRGRHHRHSGSRRKKRNGSRRRAIAGVVAAVVVLAAAGVVADRELSHSTPQAAATPPRATKTVPHPKAPSTTVRTRTTIPPAPYKLLSSSPGNAVYKLTSKAQITVKAVGSCWIEMRKPNGAGTTVFVQTLAAGQRHSVTGPAWVRLGDPTEVVITVNGRTVRPPVTKGAPYNVQFQ